MIKNKTVYSLIVAFFLIFLQREIIAGDFDPFIEGPADTAFDDFDANDITFDADAYKTITPQDAFAVFAGILKAQNVLYSPFYLHTNPPRERDFNDQTFLQFPNFSEEGDFKLFPLLRVIGAQAFTQTSHNIDSYVDLQQKEFTDILSNIQQILPPLPDGDIIQISMPNIPELLQLFSGVKTQQYQIALQLQYSVNYYNWLWYWNLPIIYQMCNYFITPAEKKAIENYPLIKDFYQGGDYWDFVSNNLLADRIGIGDCALYVEKPLFSLSDDSYRLNLGLGFTIPTAFDFKNGLIGANFNRPSSYKLDLLDGFIDPAMKQITDPTNFQPEVVIQNGTKLGLAILDQLSSQIINNPLGNNGHFGVEAYIRDNYIFSENADLTSRIGIVYLVPAKEHRYIRFTLTEATRELDAMNAAIAETGDNVSAADAAIYMGQIQQLTMQHFFPGRYEALVTPGLIAKWQTQFAYNGQKWIFYAGSDLWYQAKEDVYPVNVSVPTFISLATNLAERPCAMQLRLWMGMDRPLHEHHWTWGWRLSGSPYSAGIGNDFSLAAVATYSF